MSLKYFSVCSGIESASCAWESLGWKPVGFSEIEPFPSAVLAHRFPNVKNYGDMTKYKEWKDVGQFDVLVGGTPCQSFSVAGLRRGLEDPRGNLMLTYGAIANHFKPRVLVWENVPGVLSSNGGRDFGTFLGMLAECGYGFTYRILDAQYFGVPQRRRRVFVVGYLGDWRRAAQILFESESLRVDNPPSRKTGEGVTGTISARTSGGGGLGTDFELGGGLQVAHTLRGEGFDASEDGTGRGTPIVPVAIQDIREIEKKQNGKGWNDDGTAYTVDAMATQGIATKSSVRRLTPIECERLQGFPDNWTRIPWRGAGAEDCPDGPRYKAIGNSMAVPVMRWIGERVNKFTPTPK